MENKIVEYFSRLMTLSKIEEKAILEDLEIKKFKKGFILLREGQIPKENYFVLKGCIRKYLIVNGEEKTLDLFTEEQWILSTDSTEMPPTSNHYLSCIEDCFLVIGNEEKGDKLLKRFPKFQDLSRVVLQKQLLKQQQLAASFIADSPEERYKKLQELRPELLLRVPQYQLASYLGIKPESLSRIRKRISKIKTN
jgi:CRP-like cAMP-binding protein